MYTYDGTSIYPPACNVSGDPIDQNGDTYVLSTSTMSAFVRLTPSNHEAKCAFNDVATRIKENSRAQVFQHTAQLIVIKPYTKRHADVHDATDNGCEDPGADSGEVDTDIEAGGTEIDTEPESVVPTTSSYRLQYEGHYELLF